MIPSPDDFLRGYRFTAHRYGAGEPVMAEMRAGLRLARTLAGERAADEPSALLYALIICRRAFPRRWSNMALALTRTHAARHGRALHLGPDEAEGLFFGVTEGPSQ